MTTEEFLHIKEQRVEVFHDTLDWIATDPDLSASIGPAKRSTAVYFEDDYPAYDASIEKDTKITVTPYRSFEAARRLHREFPDKRIAVMSFANAFHTGGGVTKGASAQEESLCRESTLYPLIYRRSLRDTFYKHHWDLNTLKASDSLIYTEGVIICKTDEDLPKRLPKSEWVSVDVITIAAPHIKEDMTMQDAELFGYHVKRAIHMLTVAASRKADILVLGAFGCGAFKNNPVVVAKAYKTALSVFPKVFDRIEFAIYTSPYRTIPNYEIFKKELAPEAD